LSPAIVRAKHRVSEQDNDLEGFTLIELLVSMAVMAILVVLFVQMLTMGMSAWNSGRSQADNFSQARVALDVIARDLATAAVRKDLPAFFDASSSPALTFYTEQQGLIATNTTGNRPLSRVFYQVTNGGDGSSLLRRSANGFNFGDEVGYSPAVWGVVMATNSTFDADIGRGVLVMKHQFIGTNGLNVLPAGVNNAWTNSTNSPALPGIKSLRALTISMAVVDGETLKLLNSLGKLSQLQANFETNDPGAVRSFASTWQAQLDNPNHPLANGGIPIKLLRGLKTFERTIMLPTPLKE